MQTTSQSPSTAAVDDTAALMTIAMRPPQRFVRGNGSWLIDSQGKRYLDFVQGWAVNTLGHCPPQIRNALAAQAAELINCSPAYHNAVAPRFAAAVAARSGLDQVFFANSGAEANEGAIKLARKWGLVERGGAFEIITFDGGFHGRTLATMAASGKPTFAPLFEPKVPGFPKARFGDLDSVQALVGPRTVAVMLEPIQGEAGVYPATTEFLRALRAFTTERGLLLIFDEIQTGIGRTGELFDYRHAGVLPDILTLAKGLGGGVPLAALLARAEICCFAPGDQGGTFNGNPLMCAVGEAILETVSTQAFQDRVKQASARLWAGLEILAQRHALGAVRGRGLLLGLALPRGDAAAIVATAFDRGFLLNAPRADTLRFMPALNVTDEEIDEALRRLDQAFETCSR